MNKLYFGDNLHILREHIKDEGLMSGTESAAADATRIYRSAARRSNARKWRM